MSTQQIKDAISSFLSDWDRHEWMRDHGEWASAEWDYAREEYDAALAELRSAVDGAGEGDETSDDSEARSIIELAQELARCAEALDGQVLPDDSDYIAEGTIDPDGVADKAVCVYDGGDSQGRDCTESIDGYRVGDALYMRWYRDARGERHSRNLWVCVSGDFFRHE